MEKSVSAYDPAVYERLWFEFRLGSIKAMEYAERGMTVADIDDWRTYEAVQGTRAMFHQMKYSNSPSEVPKPEKGTANEPPKEKLYSYMINDPPVDLPPDAMSWADFRDQGGRGLRS